MTLLTLGGLFLLGLIADILGRFTPSPRITLLLVAGVLIGPGGFSLVSKDFVDGWFVPLTHIALAMVGFLMGQKLSLAALKQRGRLIVMLAGGKVIGAALSVSLIVWLISRDLSLALVMGGVATATAPAATFDVVHESGLTGTFADDLLSVVAIDDALGLMLFSILLTAAVSMTNGGLSPDTALHGLTDLFGSLLLATALAIPMSFLTGRLDFGQRKGEPIQSEAIEFVLICAGAATMLNLSPILASMTMGALVVSLAKHHNRPFHAIEGFEWPFMILFFILAGASLNLNTINTVGYLVIAYILARAAGTYLGFFGAAVFMKSDDQTRNLMGLTLMPQAGVALSMALIASQRLPDSAEIILSLVLCATILLEFFSPMLTRRILNKVANS